MSSWLVRNPTSLQVGQANKDTYVTVELSGGFANRVFQILAAQHIAEKTKRTFVLVDTFILENAHQAVDETMRELDILFKGLPMYVGEPTEWLPVVEEQYTWYTYNVEFLHRNKGKNIVLKGFFQNELYFPRQMPSIEVRPRINTYFLHLQFGEYLNTVHDVGLAVYYRKAIQNILMNSQLSTFIVFSNEPDKVDEYIQNEIQYPIRYTISHAGTPLTVLKEMAECSGGICSNSSLSYLGAYFQRKPRGKIFMPDIWMKTIPKKQMVGFYPAWALVYTIRDAALGSRTN
jgi:hypothetical protein